MVRPNVVLSWSEDLSPSRHLSPADTPSNRRNATRVRRVSGSERTWFLRSSSVLFRSIHSYLSDVTSQVPEHMAPSSSDADESYPCRVPAKIGVPREKVPKSYLRDPVHSVATSSPAPPPAPSSKAPPCPEPHGDWRGEYDRGPFVKLGATEIAFDDLVSVVEHV